MVGYWKLSNLDFLEGLGLLGDKFTMFKQGDKNSLHYNMEPEFNLST